MILTTKKNKGYDILCPQSGKGNFPPFPFPIYSHCKGIWKNITEKSSHSTLYVFSSDGAETLYLQEYTRFYAYTTKTILKYKIWNNTDILRKYMFVLHSIKTYV